MRMYRLTDAQTTAVQKARDAADGVAAKFAEDVDRNSRFPAEAVQALGESGLLGLTTPVDYGGMGENIRTAVAVLDEIAQRDASVGMIYLMHLCGIACYAASSRAAEMPLREAAAGRHLSTLA